MFTIILNQRAGINTTHEDCRYKCMRSDCEIVPGSISRKITEKRFQNNLHL